MDSEEGVPQGATASPLLANVYLHYSLDLWVNQWRKRHARGDMVVVRFADDSVLGFQHKSDAERFLADMRERLQGFSLSLHPDKTRLIEFGRFAASSRERQGLGKPETFTFLGFTFICGEARDGRFFVQRSTRRDRMQATLKRVKEELRRRRHEATSQQGRTVWIGGLGNWRRSSGKRRTSRKRSGGCISRSRMASSDHLALRLSVTVWR